MKKIYRCRWNRKIAGVLGGLGVYLNIDPTILRIIFIALIIPTGVFVLPIIYLIAALLLPEGPKHYIRPNSRRLYKSLHDRKIAGVCAGIAECFNIDPTVVRLITLVLTIITGVIPLLLLYFVSILLIPFPPSR